MTIYPQVSARIQCTQRAD